jgi:hypothetical protein
MFSQFSVTYIRNSVVRNAMQFSYGFVQLSTEAHFAGSVKLKYLVFTCRMKITMLKVGMLYQRSISADQLCPNLFQN